MPSKSIPELVQNFYDQNSQAFSDSRAHFWPGWEKLWDYLEIEHAELVNNSTVSILDLGCGNGRLAEFYATKLESKRMNYLGLDISKQLLAQAEVKLANIPAKIELKQFDLSQTAELEKLLGQRKFELINLMAVTHHLPSAESRTNLFRILKGNLSPTGLIVFTTWEFTQEESLEKLIVSGAELEEYLQANSLELGENDYFLRWGGMEAQKSFRFVHAFTQQEVMGLIKDSGLILRHSFAADGRNGKLNHYYILSLEGTQ